MDKKNIESFLNFQKEKLIRIVGEMFEYDFECMIDDIRQMAFLATNPKACSEVDEKERFEVMNNAMTLTGYIAKINDAWLGYSADLAMLEVTETPQKQ